MKTIHCNSDAKHIRNFLNASDGNWHNCLYVKCTTCQSPATCPDAGFLFHPDQTAIPLVLPLNDAKLLFAQDFDPDECLCTISLQQFSSMYHDYLAQHSLDAACPVKALLKFQENQNYNW